VETAKLTIRLPKEIIAFAEEYAKAHQLTMTELISRHLRRLRDQAGHKIHPDVEEISGIIPATIDARAEYHEHLAKKHR
jgi:hypothetical protein